MTSQKGVAVVKGGKSNGLGVDKGYKWNGSSSTRGVAGVERRKQGDRKEGSKVTKRLIRR